MIYIASPYYHTSKRIRLQRIVEAERYLHYLFSLGIDAFSPIVHNGRGAEAFGPVKMERYFSLDCHMMDSCSMMHILALPGWTTSRGVAVEIGYMMAKDRPIRLVQNSDTDAYSSHDFIISNLYHG